MDPRQVDDGSRGELLAEYHWVAGTWRRWLVVALVLSAAVAGIEVVRALGLFPEQLKPLEGAQATAKPVKAIVSFVMALGFYLSKTSYYLSALQLSWRTTPVPLFADGAVSRSELVGIDLDKFPGVPEFLSKRGYTLVARLRSGEKRHMLQYAAREPALEIGQILAAETNKPGPS